MLNKRYAAQKRSNFGKEGTLFEKEIELEKSLMQSTLANGRAIKGARIVKRMLGIDTFDSALNEAQKAARHRRLQSPERGLGDVIKEGAPRPIQKERH